MESILDSIKYLLGGQAMVDDTNFDMELIIHINGALMILNQLGVGPIKGFRITSKEDTWEGLIGNRTDLELIKTNIYLKVRLTFDPPQNSFLVKAIEEQIKEYDWRIMCHVETNEHLIEDDIKPDTSYVEIILVPSSWIGDGPYTQSISVPEITGTRNGVIGISPNISIEQREAARDALLGVLSQTLNKIIIVADGIKPIVPIPLGIVII